MANIKSAKKRILIAKDREDRNKSVKSSIKTAVKKVEAAVESGDREKAQECLKAASTALSKATSKGIFHKNTSSRKISRMSKSVNKMS